MKKILTIAIICIFVSLPAFAKIKDDVYPKAKKKVVVEKLDEATVAANIVHYVSAGIRKGQAIALVLDGSDDVATFNKMWNIVEAEGEACRTVNPADYNNATEFKAALPVVYLSANDFYTGLLDEYGAADYAELKAEFTTGA